MLIKVNDHLVLNVDAIAAANWNVADSRWRVVMRGHGADSPVVYLTEEELTRIMDEVSVRQMIVLMRMSGSTHRGTRPAPQRPNDGQQETHR